MPLIHNHPQVPPGGYTFTDPTGVFFQADTLKALLQKIADYRTANGLPPGSPEKEVETDYRTRFPWLVTKVGTAPEPKEDPVARWINRQWKAPTQARHFVEAEVERVRLETCAKCPYYAKDHAYTAETARRLIILGAGRAKDNAACMVNHWPVGYAALLPKADGIQVDGCWAATE